MKFILIITGVLLLFLIILKDVFAVKYSKNTPPTIKASIVRYIRIDSAIAGGIINNARETIIRAGVSYSNNSQPTVNDFVVEKSTNTDTFICELLIYFYTKKI